MTNTTINKIILSATTAMFLTACGGGGGGTTPTAAEAASAKIQAYAVDDNAAQPVLADYQALGLTDVNASNIDEYNDLIKAKDSADEVDELSELNAIIAAANANVNAAANTAPTATLQTVTVDEDTSANAITLTGTDVDAGDTLTYTIVTQPTNGTLSGTAPAVTYTPNANYFGADSFTFTVNDGTVDSAPATVTINVTDVPEPNVAPVATAQAITVDEDTMANAITLVGTDADASDTLTYTITTPPTNGTLSGTAPAVTYTPNANYFGADSFAFTVNDGTEDSAPATVSITVNDIPDIVSRTFTLSDDNTTISDGAGLTWKNELINITGACTDTTGYRTPDVQEILTIVDHTKNSPGVQEVFAPLMTNLGVLLKTSDSNRTLRVIDGTLAEESAYNANRILCVTGTFKANEHNVTRDDANETNIDNVRNIEWYDKSLLTNVQTYADANTTCANLVGGTWTLPTMEQVEGIYSMQDKEIYEAFQSNLITKPIWTKDQILSGSYTWTVDFAKGLTAVKEDNKLLMNVLCVKDAD